MVFTVLISTSVLLVTIAMTTSNMIEVVSAYRLSAADDMGIRQAGGASVLIESPAVYVNEAEPAVVKSEASKHNFIDRRDYMDDPLRALLSGVVAARSSSAGTESSSLTASAMMSQQRRQLLGRWSFDIDVDAPSGRGVKGLGGGEIAGIVIGALFFMIAIQCLFKALCSTVAESSFDRETARVQQALSRGDINRAEANMTRASRAEKRLQSALDTEAKMAIAMKNLEIRLEQARGGGNEVMAEFADPIKFNRQQRYPANNLKLAQLLAPLRDAHSSLPEALREHPVRLIKIRSLLSWPTLLMHENVPADAYQEVKYSELSDGWDNTVVVSWRWSVPKPAAYDPDYSPMADDQLADLKAGLEQAIDVGHEFVWIDWCCVPQYDGDPMVEIARSRLFYARARTMLVIPTKLDIPQQPFVAVFTEALLDNLSAGSSRSNARNIAHEVLQEILKDGRLAKQQYFGRA